MVANDDSLDTLKMSWKRPLGNLDFYNVTLFQHGSFKESKILQAQVTETYFDKLISGRLYEVNVNAISGELFTKVTARGRTSMFLIFLSTF